MERRLGHRLNNHTSVRLRMPRGEVADAEIRDLSLSGAFVLTDRPVRLAATVQLLFPPRVSGQTAAVAGWVTRTETGGIGIEWTDFAPRPVSELLFAHWTREATEQIDPQDRGGRRPLR